MKKIKGYWIGTVEIIFDATREKNMLPTAEIARNAKQYLAADIASLINEELVSGGGAAKVTMEECEIAEVDG